MKKLSLIYTIFRKSSTKSSAMKYLNVAEKHDAAKTISGLLSNGTARRREGLSVYNKIFEFEANVCGQKCKMTMTSVSGHMLNYEFLQSYKGWTNCDPQQLFDAPIRKNVTENGVNVKKTIEREIKSCQGLIVWTDCDREGENIGYEVIEVCKKIRPNITIYRAKFSEITGAAIRRALANLIQPDPRQNNAVDVRQEIDLRTGAAFTRYQTLRLQRLFPINVGDNLISYGSCQIPTLGFVAERYKEAEEFVSEPFWKIKVTHTIDDLTVEFNWDRNRLFNKEACEDYLLLCLADPKATVDNVTVKPKNKWRPNPMDTVEMEKLGSRKLKINAKDTMAIAEKLYTQGLISYPRTETNSFSPDVNLRSLVEQHTSHPDWGGFANRVLEWGPNPRNGNKSDQAHPPIHPTKFTTSLSGNEARIYELIVRHFLACISKDATGSETIVNINIAGEKFHANGLVIYERNYLDVYPYEKWNAKQIHNYEIAQVFDPTEISMQEGATTAPPLLTEADLIALMEKHGIGTDATHAEHIHKIKERGYIGEVDRGFLVPGTIGMGLYEGYGAMDLALAKPMLRAEFEADLKKICNGQKDPKVVLLEQIIKYKEAYKIITERITAMDEKFGQRINETPRGTTANASDPTSSFNQQRTQDVFKCPKCGICHMALKTKKNNTGYFIGCLNYPDCKNVVWLSEYIKEAKLTNEFCSNCGNDSRKIEFKFKLNSFLGQLNATGNSYTTCLRCDSNFRIIFDINVDQVKNTGPIVDDSYIQTISPQRNIRNPSDTNTNITSSLFLNRNNSADSGSRPTNRNNTRKKPPKNTRSHTTTVTTTTHRQESIDNNTDYVNLMDDEWDTELNLNVIATETDMLNDDDGFDDILGSADFNLINENQSNHNRFNSSDTNQNTTLNVPSNLNGNNENIRGSNSRNHNSNWETQNRNNSSWGSSGNSTISSRENHFSNQDRSPLNQNGWGSSNISNPTFQSQISHRNNTNQNQTRPNPNTSNWRNSGTSEETELARETLNNSNATENESFYTWGSSGRTYPIRGPQESAQLPNQHFSNQNSAINRNNSDNSCRTSQNPTSNSSPSNNINKINTIDDNVNCTVCNQPALQLTVKKDGPNKGRQFYSCPNRCSFFQWADEQPKHSITPSTSNQNLTRNSNSENNIATTDIVKCSGCNQPAKSLTVRKEGPNQGRPFYVCSNSNQSCGFFKWADENVNPNQGEPSTSWGSRNQPWGTGTSRGASTSTRGSHQNNNEPKKRKCGLCRNEGHTKLKCPRKDEFN